MNKASIAFLICCIAITTTAQADRCWMTGGCIGDIGYMYLTEKQKSEAHIFRESGVPKEGNIAHLKAVNSYYGVNSIKHPDFIKSLNNISPSDFGPQWGGQLGSGAQVKVLGYKEFSDISELKGKIFINVLIVTDTE
jgi:hypothetical protein